jgi:methionyl-tRNA synthetase
LDQVDNFLFSVANSIRIIAVLIGPILTNGSKKIIQQMKFNNSQLSFTKLDDFELLNQHQVGVAEAIYLRHFPTNKKED